MNEEIKAQWVAALRSGEYVQGKSSLHFVDENGNAWFCCLGVLCDLAVKAGGVVKEVDTPKEEQLERVVYYDGNHSFPPPSVVEWAGLRDRYGRVPGSLYDVGALYMLNDAGTSFADIADVIENGY